MSNDIILSLIWGAFSMVDGIMCLILGYIIGKKKQTNIINYYTVDGKKTTTKNCCYNDIDFPNSRKK